MLVVCNNRVDALVLCADRVYAVRAPLAGRAVYDVTDATIVTPAAEIKTNCALTNSVGIFDSDRLLVATCH